MFLHLTYLCFLLIFYHGSSSCTASPTASRSNENPTPSTPPLITLDYMSLRGVHSPTYNLTHYRRIPFAAPPTGPNRFRAPQSPLPLPNTTVYDTDRAFDMCPQRTVNGSEDCLYLGVYSRPWQPSQKPRPVLLTFYGGGFIQGSATFSIPPPGFPVLNVSDTNDYVVVYANYRTNVFGFLPGSRVKASPHVDLNAGLLDQRAALRWIRKYIHHFGGDAEDVAIWGQSAGGGSVVAQTIARQGTRGKAGKEKLFKRSMASSPFWPKTYRYDDAESEALYEQVVVGVGCNKGGTEEQIACLKEVDVQSLRDVSLRISTQNVYGTSSFTWGPVTDGEFLARPLSEVVKEGSLNADRVMASYNLHEGENFLPQGLKSSVEENGFNSSREGFDKWLRGFLPGFEDKDIQGVKMMYRESDSAEEIAWNATWERAGMVYRDLVLACPAYWLAGKADKGRLIEYTIDPAKHASDTVYWNTINPLQMSNPQTYQGYTGAMASFIQTGDPNRHKLTNSSVVGVPRLKTGRQFIVSSKGLKDGGFDKLEKRCAFWLRNAKKVPF